MRDDVIFDSVVDLAGDNPAVEEIVFGAIGPEATMRAAHVRVMPGTFSSCSTLAELMSTLSWGAVEVREEVVGPWDGLTKAPATWGRIARKPPKMNTNRVRNLTSFILSLR